ncbi:SCO family protein [Saliphagus infecundisoli]|uniref:SCO family protein n=1 Tax=Saliphagus infecundisoli TaxID=1849069 RepID=A0ABD5QAR7_9EURY|nr:SCO family protein [Saliphagus infecundisoli]
MDRRSYLRHTAAVGSILGAGCLSTFRDSGPTVLDKPEWRRAESEALSFPAFEEQLPEVTLPSPLHDREVTTTEFEGDRHVLVTFIFTRCMGPCPVLTSNLAQVQVDAAENGYGDEIALLPITFDPQFDTAERLQAFSEDRGADPTADNWQFLRPSSFDRVTSVVNETFGVGVEKTETYDLEPRGNQSNNQTDGDQQNTEHDGGNAPFVHVVLTVLVNRDGYVERAYDGSNTPTPAVLIDDLGTVRNSFD